MARFRDNNILDPEFRTKSAVTAGALEVYDYLLTMDEEDLNAAMETDRE